MKSVLYVGATLMIGASVYGFVDYKQTQNKKEFKQMYVDEKKLTPEPVVEEVTTEPVSKVGIAVIEKNSVEKKKLVVKNHPVDVITDPAIDDETISTAPAETDEITAIKGLKEISKTSVDIKPAKDNNVVKKTTKKKKFSTRLFSRAPLREEEELPPLKTDLKKTEDKEQ